MDDPLFNVKFQTFTNLCMSNIEFDTPDEFMELFSKAVDYIVTNTDMDPKNMSRDTVLNLVN